MNDNYEQVSRGVARAAAKLREECGVQGVASLAADRLETQLGRHVSGVARSDGGVDWSFGRKRGLGL